jgi:hypothetical protein
MFACAITFLCTALMSAFAGFILIPHPQGAAIAQQVFLASLLLFAGFALAELFGLGSSTGTQERIGVLHASPPAVAVALKREADR